MAEIDKEPLLGLRVGLLEWASLWSSLQTLLGESVLHFLASRDFVFLSSWPPPSFQVIRGASFCLYVPLVCHHFCAFDLPVSLLWNLRMILGLPG